MSSHYMASKKVMVKRWPAQVVLRRDRQLVAATLRPGKKVLLKVPY